MRASLLEVPSVRLPIKEYYPECSNPSACLFSP